MGGHTRSGDRYPWAEDMPEVFRQLESLTRDKCVVMGPTTFQAFSNYDYGRYILTDKKRHSCFILTKNKNFSPPENYPVQVVRSLGKVRNIWHSTHRLEEAKHENDEKNIELQRQKLIKEKKLSPKQLYKVETEPRLEKEIVAIGGRLLYRRILDYADRIYMFLICENFSGDTILPPIDSVHWKQNPNNYQEYPANKENKYDLLRVTWERKNSPPKSLF